MTNDNNGTHDNIKSNKDSSHCMDEEESPNRANAEIVVSKEEILVTCQADNRSADKISDVVGSDTEQTFNNENEKDE